MANYFMNMYSVSPVLSAQSVVPLSTINHSDAVAISIPSAPNISNNNAVRTSHPHTSHANTHSHMHMVAQPTIVGHRTVQHAAHNSSQQQQQSHGTSHAGHATQHQATTTGAQRSATASRTMTVPCDTPYVCGVCNQGFRKPGSLKKHMRVHMSANVSCDPVSSTDIVINSNAFFCFFFVFCIFFFGSGVVQGIIDTAHPQALKCTQCGCFRPITLTSLKPFRCEQCATTASGAFESVGMLRYQINKSGSPTTAQHVHVTPGTSCTTGTKANIKMEMASILHQHGVFADYFKKPTKHYKCNECDKSYRHQSTLAMHKKTHTGDVKYRCEHCGKEFYLTEYYQRHLRVHTKEKPYTCDICNKSFSQSNTLTQHKRTHTGRLTERLSILFKSSNAQFNLPLFFSRR